MSTVADIERAIEQLSQEELIAFRDWFLERDAKAWDRQFEADVSAGNLDALGEQAIDEFRAGRCTEL